MSSSPSRNTNSPSACGPSATSAATHSAIRCVRRRLRSSFCICWAGASTTNDPRGRAYALQKTMFAIELGVELGAGVYVFWGGREGVETDAAKNPVTATQPTRAAMHVLCEYVPD